MPERGRNRLVAAINGYLPAAIKRQWVEEFHEDASVAFKALLTGSAHVCDECHCERPNVHAVRLYAELAGMVGQANQFIFSLGFKSEGELLALAEQGRRLEAMKLDASSSLEAAVESAVSLLLLAFREDPTRRASVLARLQSEAVVTSE